MDDFASSYDSNMFTDEENLFSVPNQLYVMTKARRCLKISRENYLRSNIPCQSALCHVCRQPNEQNHTSSLSKDANHYILPAVDVLQNYLDLFEAGREWAIIFTQTSCTRVVFAKGKRFWRRIRYLIRDSDRNCVLFMNQFHAECYVTRDTKGETSDQWYFRLVYETALFYYRHLSHRIPIIVLTDNETFRCDFGSKNADVFVLSMHDYLKMFEEDNNSYRAIMQIYNSLQVASVDDQTELEGAKEYQEYLPSVIWSQDPKRYVVGTLKVNQYKAGNDAFVVVKNQSNVLENSLDENEHVDNSENLGDIFISGMKNRNRAIHGDVVVVDLCSERKEQENRGKIVAVSQRKWRDYVCTIQQQTEGADTNDKRTKLLAVPYDTRIPKIRVGTTLNYANLQAQRILVRIDDWPAWSSYPNGHYLQFIGPANNLETEIQCLLFENELLVRPFTEAQLNEVPNPDTWTIPNEELANRLDLRRSHLIYSIDPPGCQDVDDTLSIKLLDDGETLQLGVHIADVGYFVRPQSLVDAEASKRTTTIYLADRRFDMLPENLSTKLCSLWSGVDRLAVSVLWNFDYKTLKLKDIWYGRTVIRSRYKLQYETAQIIYDSNGHNFNVIEAKSKIYELEKENEDTVVKKLKELQASLQQLVRVAAQLNANRKGLELEGVEIDVRIDKNYKNVNNIFPKTPLLMHEVVAECMIYANHWVAKKLLETFPTKALLRSHKPPSQKKLEKLKCMAKVLGLDIDCTSNQTLSNSLTVAALTHNPDVVSLLKNNVVLSMQRATYVSSGSSRISDFSHYGLNLEQYTHFTSPIRRYADIIVHRQLLAAVGGNSGSANEYQWTELSDLCDVMNDKHICAQNAQRSSVELFQMLFFKSKSPNDPSLLMEGIVCDILNDRLVVVVPNYAIRAPCFLKNTDNLILFDESWMTGTLTFGNNNTSLVVTSSLGQRTYKLFQNVTVRLSVADSLYHPSRFQFSLVNCTSEKNNQEHATSFNRREIISDVVKHLNQLKLNEFQNIPVNPDAVNKPGKSLHSMYDFFQEELHSLSSS